MVSPRPDLNVTSYYQPLTFKPCTLLPSTCKHDRVKQTAARITQESNLPPSSVRETSSRWHRYHQGINPSRGEAVPGHLMAGDQGPRRRPRLQTHTHHHSRLQNRSKARKRCCSIQVIRAVRRRLMWREHHQIGNNEKGRSIR